MSTVRLSFVVLFTGIAVQAFAGELDLQRFCRHPPTPNQIRLLRDLADRELNQSSLLEAALIAAGYSSSDIADCQRRLHDSLASCRLRIRADAELVSRIRTVFEHVSQEFLHKQYVPDLHDMRRTISAGEFNCLTATILFQTVCEELSIRVSPVWEPSHVSCWCPATAGLGYHIEMTASTSAEGIRADVAPGARLLSKVELLAKVFYNQGVRALKDEDYSHAISATWIGCLLDPQDNSAHSNLRAGFNNWALKAWEDNDTDRARALLEEGLQLDPHYQPFSRNLARLTESISSNSVGSRSVP